MKRMSLNRLVVGASVIIAAQMLSAQVAVAEGANDSVRRFFSASSLEDITLRRLESTSFYPGVTVDMKGDGLASFYSGSEAIRYGYSSTTAAYINPDLGISIIADLSGKANFATTNFLVGAITATDTTYCLSSDLLLLRFDWNYLDASVGLQRNRDQIVYYPDTQIVTQMLDSSNFSLLPTDSFKPVFRVSYAKALEGFVAMGASSLERVGLGFDILRLPTLLALGRIGGEGGGASAAANQAGGIVLSGAWYDTVATGRRLVPKIAFDAGYVASQALKLGLSGSADAWIDTKDVAAANLGLARADASIELGYGTGYFADFTGEVFQRSFVNGAPQPFSQADLSYGYRIEAGFFMAPPYPILLRFKVGYGVNDFDLVSVSPMLIDAANYYFSLSLGFYVSGK